MNIELDTLSCMGCHACVSVCPQKCITMHEDKLGFLRPSIEKDTCIGCGRCVKACNQVKRIPSIAERKIYAAKHKDKTVKENSSSGGVFSAISNVVFKNGGVVVGAVYNEQMQVEHVFAQTPEECKRMRGSKYTYSICDETVFIRIKELLSNNRIVLFTGTPCQVSALKVYLGKDYDNLLTVDILCHGIFAPAIYKDYICQIQNENDPINFINFRHYTDDWHTPITQVTYKSGKKRQGERENAYFKMFVSDYCLRESCYKCTFASFNRVSDITLGDFWGIEKSHSEFDAPDGVSVVIVNTVKGENWFKSASIDLVTLNCNEKDCLHDQLNGLKPNGRKQEFVADYERYGYKYVVNKYTRATFSIRLKTYLKGFKCVRKALALIKK